MSGRPGFAVAVVAMSLSDAQASAADYVPSHYDLKVGESISPNFNTSPNTNVLSLFAQHGRSVRVVHHHRCN